MNTKKILIIVYLAILLLVATKQDGYSQSVWNHDSSRKNVLIVADNEGTEMFDMLAPFYLFAATGKANVYIVAEHKGAIVVKRGLLALPHFTFKQIDSLHIEADVIVVPNQSRGVKNQKKVTVNFIRTHYTGSNRILSVCDGSATVAETGLYDGKYLTTHSSDFAGLKKHFTKPAWILGTTVTQSDNLYSTAGVANAAEGSLTVIGDLFGQETMQLVMSDVHYPYPAVRKDHQNLLVDKNPIYVGLRKGKVNKTRKIGVLLQNGINEFDLAAILDCYFRSFPASLDTFTVGSSTVTSRYGLTLQPTGNSTSNACTELHILMPESFPETDRRSFKNAEVIAYDQNDKRYIIDVCLKRISDRYGVDFGALVKLMLDYND